MLTTSAKPPASGKVKMKIYCKEQGQTQVYKIKYFFLNKYIANFRDTIVWTEIISLQGTLFFGSDKSSRKANVRSFGESLSRAHNLHLASSKSIQIAIRDYITLP